MKAALVEEWFETFERRERGLSAKFHDEVLRLVSQHANVRNSGFRLVAIIEKLTSALITQESQLTRFKMNYRVLQEELVQREKMLQKYQGLAEAGGMLSAAAQKFYRQDVTGRKAVVPSLVDVLSEFGQSSFMLEEAAGYVKEDNCAEEQYTRLKTKAELDLERERKEFRQNKKMFDLQLKEQEEIMKIWALESASRG
jgi:hypothetical protein